MQSAKQGGKKMLKGAKKGLKSTGEFLISDQGQYVVWIYFRLTKEQNRYGGEELLNRRSVTVKLFFFLDKSFPI